MDLKQLRYFVAVAGTGHITRAAAELGIQQPPLSQQIRALEQELGVPLFLRHPKGVTLTEAGSMLLADCKRLLADVDAIRMRMQSMSEGHAGVLAVGFTSSAAAHQFTPHVLRECRRSFPDIALQIAEDHAAGITEAVGAGRLDCGFIRVPVARPEGLVFETILREPVMAAVPKGRFARGKLQLRQLKDENFILVRQAGAPGIYANLLSLCERQGFTPRVTQEVSRMVTALNLVAAGEGVTVVPASMRGVHAAAVDYLPLETSRSLDAPLTLVYRERPQRATLKSFIRLLHGLQQEGRG